MSKNAPLKIGIIAGEASGDVLGAGLLKALKVKHPDCEVSGIGGKYLIAQGLHSIVDMNELSVMGLVEVLKHLPRLLSIRKQVIEHFIQNPPDVFIGVDAPDFNLRIASALKENGVKTVHYVSPTIWAWRESRIHKIAKATNLVLGIFPFEQSIYEKYKVPYTYVGHTLADEIPLYVDRQGARSTLARYTQSKAFHVEADTHVLAILPGSRAREIESMLPVFLETAKLYSAHFKALKVFIPAANKARHQQILDLLKAQHSRLDVHVTDAPARDVMIASDAVLLTSGTASLEAMLCKRPMVVAYRMSGLTYKIMQYLYKPDYFSLPNILAEEALVPELLQEEVNPANMCAHLLEQIERDQNKLSQAYFEQHLRLRQHANEKAADAVLALIEDTKC
uniref:lipid-A-disaccharide synthase n=1 Tax=Ningiella ruwaisensis TaxID=2364274 RepID=UPI00109F1B79|nr:lipid-A-disaccharide synthase [Ningiella ruwaisensis]